jgi:hypothetical protein
MAGDFFPRKDGAFVGWSAALRRNIVADPQAYGIDEQRAAQCAQLDDELSQAYSRAASPITRTAGAVQAKNDARRACERAVRYLSHAVKAAQGTAGVPVENVLALGLNPRDRGGRHAILRAPETAPGVWIESVDGRRVTVHVFDKDVPGRRRRPRGAKSALLLSFIGQVPPPATDGWTLCGMMAKPKKTITFGSNLPPGTRVWFQARWASPTGEWGPLSNPIDTNLPGDRTSMRPVCVAA